MLSIGKLAAGQADYYLDEEEGRVDPVESLEGAEEYYLGSGEARGVWLGAGSAQLGLVGDVEGAHLRAVLAAVDSFSKRLSTFRQLLESGDHAGLVNWLTEGKQVRDALGT